MESFEEMKQRYEKEMMRYARQAKPQAPAAPPAEPKAQPVMEAMSPVEAPRPAPALAPPAVQPPARRTEPSVRPAEDPSPAEGTAPDREEGDTAYGTLAVRVFTAKEALPVFDALVLVSRAVGGRPTLQWSGRTDISGNTGEIRLPAPEAALSEEPGHIRPYAAYRIQVEKDGFYMAEFRDVPVFSGVTSVQPVELIPLPQRESSVREMVVVEREPSDL